MSLPQALLSTVIILAPKPRMMKQTLWNVWDIWQQGRPHVNSLILNPEVAHVPSAYNSLARTGHMVLPRKWNFTICPGGRIIVIFGFKKTLIIIIFLKLL